MKKLKTSFGSRYGFTLRKRYAEIMQEYKKPKKCPICKKLTKMRRIKIGIWQCKKCNSIFTGAAYTLSTPIGLSLKSKAAVQFEKK